ncbi:MAG: hypothetical protein ABIF87_16365 [Pseudomonadota bacterium]
MKLDTTFLRSKVSRRIFGLFVCCALLPIVILAVVSFGHVAKQLNEEELGHEVQSLLSAPGESNSTLSSFEGGI